MPVQIGQKPSPDFLHPIRLLSDCHRRIEIFLATLVKVTVDAGGGELNVEQRRALTAALQYFRDAAPKHTDDEEQSLFPRLRASGGDEIARVLAEVDRLEDDHIQAASLHMEVDQIATLWLDEGRLTEAKAERLRTLTQQLSSIYRDHILAEDTLVFPLAERVLAPEAQQEIGREMAARRGVAASSATTKCSGPDSPVHSSL